LGISSGRFGLVCRLAEGSVQGGDLGVDDDLNLFGAEGGQALESADIEKADGFLMGIKKVAGANLNWEYVFAFVLVEDSAGPATVSSAFNDGFDKLVWFVG